jgi:uncharacterized membrane protein YoaK (UPF0700 family)
MTGLAVFFSAMRVAGPLGSVALILLAICVFAHVAGNALGTRLREHSDRSLDPVLRAQARSRRPTAHEFAPQSQLSRRGSLGKSMIVITTIGVVIGAVAGGILLSRVNRQQATVSNITLGTLSFGVLGGLAGFWVSSFLQVFIGAWYDAHRDSEDRG